MYGHIYIYMYLYIYIFIYIYIFLALCLSLHASLASEATTVTPRWASSCARHGRPIGVSSCWRTPLARARTAGGRREVRHCGTVWCLEASPERWLACSSLENNMVGMLHRLVAALLNNMGGIFCIHNCWKPSTYPPNWGQTNEIWSHKWSRSSSNETNTTEVNDTHVCLGHFASLGNYTLGFRQVTIEPLVG